MKSFKDINNQIYAYESDGSQDVLIKPDLTPITEEEADSIRNPVPTLADLAEAVRLALQSAIDDKAKEFGFMSGGNALMLYAGFVNPFQPLAQVFAAWEASVWYEAELYKAEVIAGNQPILSPEEAVALMPIYPS